MKLYASGASPFVRKAIIALHETGLAADTQIQSVKVSPLNSGDDVPTANPLGKIPCLVLDDGTSIYDSRNITRFLDAHSKSNKLYPAADAWDVFTFEATVDGIMDAAVAMVYESRLRPAETVSDELIEAQWQKVDRALSAVENGYFDLVDANAFMGLILVAALEYIDLRHEDRNWRAAHPKLADWHQSIQEHPTLVATRPNP